jgi:hypothetical protein
MSNQLITLGLVSISGTSTVDDRHYGARDEPQRDAAEPLPKIDPTTTKPDPRLKRRVMFRVHVVDFQLWHDQCAAE